MLKPIETMSWGGIICRRRLVPSPLPSVRSSSVDYFSLCSRLGDPSIVLGVPLERTASMSPVCRAALVICISNGMRIGEVLSLRFRDCVAPGIYAAKALKKGRAFLVGVPLTAAEQQAQVAIGADRLIFPCTYQQVYRAAIKAGVRVHIAGRSNASVTHTGRYRIAQRLAEQGDLFKVSDILHHQNAATKEYYLPRGTKKGP